MRILRKLLKVPVLLMLPLFSMLQWVGIFLTVLAGSILNLLAFLFAFTAGASYLMGLASGSEALKMLVIGFIFFILPVIAEQIIIGITSLVVIILSGLITKQLVPWLKEKNLYDAAVVAVNAAEALYGRYQAPYRE